jgi:hypothetical protein
MAATGRCPGARRAPISRMVAACQDGVGHTFNGAPHVSHLSRQRTHLFSLFRSSDVRVLPLPFVSGLLFDQRATLEKV